MILSTTQKQIGFSLFTVALYTALFGWKLALLISATIAFHELCHLWAAKYLGLPVGGFTLLPFVGGVSFISGRYKTYAQQAFVVIMGPVGGSLLGFLLAGLGLLFHQPSLLWAAYWNLFVNFANLIFPCSFVDAGQLMGTITYSINKTFGVVCNVVSTVLGVIVLFFWSPLLAVFVAYFGGKASWREIQNWQNYRAGKFHACNYEYLYPPQPLTKKQMAILIVSWISALIVMGYSMFLLHR